MEQDFSERLKRYRKERNLTRQQLAHALGVSNKSISRRESGGGLSAGGGAGDAPTGGKSVG